MLQTDPSLVFGMQGPSPLLPKGFQIETFHLLECFHSGRSMDYITLNHSVIIFLPEIFSPQTSEGQNLINMSLMVSDSCLGITAAHLFSNIIEEM